MHLLCWSQPFLLLTHRAMPTLLIGGDAHPTLRGVERTPKDVDLNQVVPFLS